MLLSYHYYRDTDVAGDLAGGRRPEVDVFADSGAFSAWRLGVRITVEEYAAWLRRWGALFTVAAALDVIGDAEATWRQTLELRALVPEVPILPVFHFRGCSGFDPLLRYLDEGYNYIGLGGLVGAQRDELTLPWMDRCFRLAEGRAGLHGFGVTTWALLKRYPWRSVDSTSWTAGFRFANLPLFDDVAGVWRLVNMRSPESLLKLRPLLERYGLSPGDCRADGYSRDRLCGVCLLSWQRAEEWLERWHSRRAP